MIINLVNSQGVLKQCKVGFSWTVLFFSFFVPLYRGDSKWALIMIGLYIITVFSIVYFEFLFLSLIWLVIPFMYNRVYIEDLLSKGFVAADEFSEQAMRQKGYIS